MNNVCLVSVVLDQCPFNRSSVVHWRQTHLTAFNERTVDSKRVFTFALKVSIFRTFLLSALCRTTLVMLLCLICIFRVGVWCGSLSPLFPMVCWYLRQEWISFGLHSLQQVLQHHFWYPCSCQSPGQRQLDMESLQVTLLVIHILDSVYELIYTGCAHVTTRH